MSNNSASDSETRQGHGRTKEPQNIYPVVLSSANIDALPLTSISDEPGRCIGGRSTQLFNSPDTPTNELNMGIARFAPRTPDQDSFLFLHRHKQAEFYYMLQGECIVKIDGVEHACKPGHCLFIPGDAEHGYWNTSTTEELVFLWGLAIDGSHEIDFRWSEGAKLISDR